MTEPEEEATTSEEALRLLTQIDQELEVYPQGWHERQRPQREENPDGIDRRTNP